MKYVFALAVALLLNASANLMMKAGMSTVAASGGIFRDGYLAAIGTVLSSTPLVVGLICFGLNAAFYMYALQSSTLQISIAYPIMVGGGYALIAVVAHWHPALAERLNPSQIVGVVLVLIGVVLIAVHTKPAGV